MKNILFALVILISALRLPAQTNGPVGLPLMETASEGTNQYLNLRLVAVKPGVVQDAYHLCPC